MTQDATTVKLKDLKEEIQKLFKEIDRTLEINKKLKAELVSANMHWEHWQEMSNINLTEVSKLKAKLAEANEKNEKLWAEIQAMNTIPRAKVQELRDKSQRRVDNINQRISESQGEEHPDDYTMGNIAGYVQACDELLSSEGKEVKE